MILVSSIRIRLQNLLPLKNDQRFQWDMSISVPHSSSEDATELLRGRW